MYYDYAARGEARKGWERQKEFFKLPAYASRRSERASTHARGPALPPRSPGRLALAAEGLAHELGQRERARVDVGVIPAQGQLRRLDPPRLEVPNRPQTLRGERERPQTARVGHVREEIRIHHGEDRFRMRSRFLMVAIS